MSLKQLVANRLDGAEHVGFCSRKRAEYLMGAARIAGGAIYVDLPAASISEDYDNLPLCYPCHGSINGEPVADIKTNAAELIAALRA